MLFLWRKITQRRQQRFVSLGDVSGFDDIDPDRVLIYHIYGILDTYRFEIAFIHTYYGIAVASIKQNIVVNKIFLVEIFIRFVAERVRVLKMVIRGISEDDMFNRMLTEYHQSILEKQAASAPPVVEKAEKKDDNELSLTAEEAVAAENRRFIKCCLKDCRRRSPTDCIHK